jgi:hypothetical protein
MTAAVDATFKDGNGTVRELGDLTFGNFVLVKAHAVPADADLSAGDAAVWYDQTNGAAKLMVKAKTANGTVVTGSVTLA